jgi:hypothetical protein
MLNPIVLLVISLLTALVIHEAAHGIVLHNLGFRLKEAGIGMPLGPQLRIKKNRRVPFDLTLSMVPVMAYVMPLPEDAKRLDALPYRDKTWYLNAGIISNLLLGAGLIGATALVDGKWLIAAIAATATAVIWVARRLIAAYVLPALSIPALGFIVWSMIGYNFSINHTGFGLAAMGESVPSGLDLSGALWFIAAVNIAIAALNATPVYGDNGKVIHALLTRWTTPKIAKVYEIGAITAIVAIFAVAVLSDLVALAFKVF